MKQVRITIYILLYVFLIETKIYLLTACVNVFITGKQLIRDMMQVDPAARITARQVKDDPWLMVNCEFK